MLCGERHAPMQYVVCQRYGLFGVWCLSPALGLYTVSKVADGMGIIKSIPVSEKQINNTFNDTFHNDINKHKAILTQKRTHF